MEDLSTSQPNIIELTQRVETLVNLTGQFRQVLERPQKWPTQIRDLGDDDYELVAPVSILVEEYPGDDVVIARFPELEVFGEGATDAEAIFNLKQAILDLYDELTETDPDLLGDLPQTWLRILCKIVVKA